MSKASALVSIVFAFCAGVLTTYVTISGGGGGEDAVTETDTDVEAPDIPTEEGAPDRFKVPVTAAQPSTGSADALVTIVEFSDFECPFCSRVNPTMDKVKKEYGDKLRIVWRNNPLPFHKNAGPAAQASLEAMAQGGSAKFWEMHDKLFANQKALTRPDLDKYAQELGLDMGKFKAAMDGNTHQAKITADQQIAKTMGARGTPAFFINGRFLSGAQPFKRFKDIIDDEIKRAEKLIKSGIPKNKIYAALIKNAKTSAATPAKNKPTARRQPDPKAIYKVPVAGAPFKGPKDALVTIIEFSDFQCPFCTRVNPAIEKIVETYGKDVRIAFKHNALPFHKDAPLAAEATIEAQAQGKFWQMHDKLFENQKALKRADLDGYAKELGLNMSKFKAALDSNKHKSVHEADQKLARSLGASGTPAFFINGRNLRGAQPFEAFKKVIDEELIKARALVKSGTPKSQLYAKIIANGATAPKFIEAPGGAAPAAKAKPDADKIYKVAAAPRAPSKGKKGAKVVIQEFSDFQCPFCTRVNPTIKKVMDEYGSRVQLVWRNYPLPFHDKAFKAAEASLEVFAQGGDKKFWAYHDLLFANQKALAVPDLEKYAQQVGGINMGKFKAALSSDKHKAAVQADLDAVKASGARIGTPSFFINGKLLQGAQPFPKFKEAIEAALAGK